MALQDLVFKFPREPKTRRRVLKWTLFFMSLGFFFNAYVRFGIPFDRVFFSYSWFTFGRVVGVIFLIFFLWLHNPNKGL